MVKTMQIKSNYVHLRINRKTYD